MAIKILKNDKDAVNTAINVSCERIYDIEELMVRGPKQLEAYSSLLKILKDLKRGCPIKKTVDRHAVQGCPPGMTSNEMCESITCQTCWTEYVQTFLKKAKEKTET
jgi:hypothetical protein